MPFQPGTRLGPYVLQEEIASGGMGVVYRALDPKLDRQVAVKVLPEALAEDPVRVGRFEREAKAVAALSHPNVMGIFDFGREDRTFYAVMELLEGESLRDRLRSGPLPPRRAVDIAAKIALGLDAAHGKGILHRDIKPENIFLCRDGQVKVLDFGLAKTMPAWNPSLPAPAAALDEATALHPAPAPAAETDCTQAGFVVGTLGYMSPEQVRGGELDARSDIFSFGVVLYEMLSGQRAFRRDSAALTFEAILHAEPPDLPVSCGPMAPGLDSILAHCLEKRPEARYQSMRDIAFALQHLESGTLATPVPPPARHGRRRLPWILAGALLALLAALLPFILGGGAPAPEFRRIGAPQGTVESAFFGRDGRTIFFTERVQGRAPEVFALYPDSDGPRSLGIQDAVLLGVSGDGELALLRNPTRRFGGRYVGLLAHAPGGGGSVKDVLEDVCDAAWDGRSMAIETMDDQGRFQVEFPAGRPVLAEEGGATGVRALRVSRRGDELAFIHSDSNVGASSIVVVDRKGHSRAVLVKRGDSLAQTLTGLAWGPGRELWFSEWEGDQTTLWALRRSGRKRLLWRGEGAKQLLDVSPDGRVLLASQRVRRGVFLQGPDGTRELSVLEGTQAAGLSADGRTLLLLESPSLDGGTARDQAYLYRVGQDAPVRLARGNPLSLAPDGSSLQLALDFLGPKDLDEGETAAFLQAGIDPATIQEAPLAYLFFMSTGAGRPSVFRLPPSFQGHGTAFRSGQDIIFQGQEKDALAWYRWSPGHGEPRAFTPEGMGAVVAGLSPLSPDGTRFVATGNARAWFVVPVSGGRPVPVAGIAKGERIVGWAADGRGLYVRSELSALPVILWRLDPVSGARRQVRVFMPPDPAGFLQIRSVFLTPDAGTAAFSYDRRLSELFEVDGLAR
jgi:eukaryotic-like serine/threonine-protein kinase